MPDPAGSVGSILGEAGKVERTNRNNSRPAGAHGEEERTFPKLGVENRTAAAFYADGFPTPPEPSATASAAKATSEPSKT